MGCKMGCMIGCKMGCKIGYMIGCKMGCKISLIVTEILYESVLFAYSLAVGCHFLNEHTFVSVGKVHLI